MRIFDENNTKQQALEQHFASLMNKYYSNISEKDRERLISRIISDYGNKRYLKNQNYTGENIEYNIDQNGEKVFKLNDLLQFPDINSEKEFPPEKYYSKDSDKHKEIVKQLKNLETDFSNNNSRIAKDLKKLLNNSEIEYRVRNNWDRPNGSCAFQKARKEGEKNKIVICIFDPAKYKNGNRAMVGVLAHELGHALDFSQRDKKCDGLYMDGAETTADFLGTSLAVNAGYDPRYFGKFMHMDYKKNKEFYNKNPIPYTPPGYYRAKNFYMAYGMIKEAMRKQDTSKEKGNSSKLDKINELRGLSAPVKAPYRPKTQVLANISSLRYASEYEKNSR